MILHVKFIGVRGKADTFEDMKKALYGYSRILGKVEGGDHEDSEFVAIICTEREDEGSCQYNAQSQADRLRSFVRWVVVGPYDRPEQLNDHDEFYGVLNSLERV